jgi:hypothetical protein
MPAVPNPVAVVLAPAPRRSRSAGSARSRSSAEASADESPAGTTRASRPSATTSGTLPTDAATEGRPRLIASSSDTGIPSNSEGKQQTSKAGIQGGGPRDVAGQHDPVVQPGAGDLATDRFRVDGQPHEHEERLRVPAGELPGRPDEGSATRRLTVPPAWAGAPNRDGSRPPGHPGPV